MSKSPGNRRILVVAAHPDDEVLGCGASIAKWADAGDEVHIAILGEGATSRHAARKDGSRAELDALVRDARAAAKIMGAKAVTFHGLPDNRFDSLDLLDVVKVVEGLVADLSPATVLTHHGSDLNVDHQVCYRAVLTATRPKPGQPVEELLAFEVASSTEWGFQTLEPVFRGNFFVDVSATLSRKVAALRAYASEICDFPHPRSAAGVEAIARRWGTVVGCAAAEAFQLVRTIR